jgi:hypothetical protein
LLQSYGSGAGVGGGVGGFVGGGVGGAVGGGVGPVGASWHCEQHPAHWLVQQLPFRQESYPQPQHA